ncbi:hypothetical protein [Vibrio harveyi]|uniref:hypothetical protein n=1 Tax=Vibrio harveyi TaxID=669 RepID=UPI00247FC73D|nr:hypothetical protein [Vibrio harveyi]
MKENLALHPVYTFVCDLGKCQFIYFVDCSNGVNVLVLLDLGLSVCARDVINQILRLCWEDLNHRDIDLALYSDEGSHFEVIEFRERWTCGSMSDLRNNGELVYDVHLAVSLISAKK